MSVNESNNLTLMSMKAEDNDKSKAIRECDPRYEIVKIVYNYDKTFQGSHESQSEHLLHASIKDSILQPMVEVEIDIMVDVVVTLKRN